MARHILFIINPISGKGRRAGLQQQVEGRLKAAGIDYSFAPSVADGNYQFLEPELSEKKVTDIVIAGGDGTINQAVNSLHKYGLNFGIIPSGSGNGLAFSARIPKNIDRALDIIIRGKSEWTDAFLVNGRFACMLCGLGFDAQVAHDFANDPRRGLSTYIKKTISNFFSAKAFPFSISSYDQQLNTEAFFISVANSNQFGNNFRIAPRASLNDGLLDIVIVTKQNKLVMLWRTALHVCGFNALQQQAVAGNKASIVYFQADSLTISNPGSAPLHIDGDPLETADRLEVKMLPKSFRLLVP